MRKHVLVSVMMMIVKTRCSDPCDALDILQKKRIIPGEAEIWKKMNAASLVKSNCRGVTKGNRKGTRSRVFTRNRSKVEKIRESLKHLELEEKQISPTKNKASRRNPGSQDYFHDLDVGICDQEISVQINKLKLPLGASKYSWPKHKEERSQATSNRLCRTRSQWSESSSSSSGSCTGTLNYCSDTKEQCLLKEREALEKCDSDWSKEYQTPKSCLSMLENTGLVDKNLKRKGVNDLKETVSKNIKGEKVCWEKLDFTAGQCEKTQATAIEESNIAIDNEQCSISPPNSPLYDMPPPSTPAQKQARRAKRHLQLERWKKFEASRSRQERYHKRTQETSQTMQKTVSMDSRRVQWSANLVKTMYIDDSDEPNLAELME